MNGKVIKDKIHSVANVQKITKTMEMVSVAKMRKAVDRALRADGYAQEAARIIRCVAQGEKIAHPYLTRQQGERSLLIIIASNKGLCGGYNMNIYKQIQEWIQKREHAELPIDVIAVGKHGEHIARRHGCTIIASYTDFSDHLGKRGMHSLVTLVLEKYRSDETYRDVHVAYTNLVTSTSYTTHVDKILPLDNKNTFTSLGDDSIPTNKEYVFEPSRSHIIEATIPGIMNAILNIMILEAVASEHSSRMIAMKNASDNAQRLKDELQLSFNRARQAAITQELSEIINAAEALA